MYTTGYIRFKHNDKKFIFDYDNISIIKIDDKVDKIVNLIENYNIKEAKNKISNYITKSEYNKLIDSMTSLGFIKNKEPIENKNYEFNNKISSITLMLMQGCNLACKYCFGDEGTYKNIGSMDLNTAKKSIDFLIENSPSNRVNLIFFGGEPLLRFDLIKKIVNYCKEIENASEFKFYYSMTTNGTLLNNEINNFIIENKINTMISIDGNKDHNSDRVYPNGKSAYKDIIDKTSYLRDKGILSARATITPKNLDIVKVFEHLNDLNFRDIPISAADNILDENEYKEYIDENIKLINQFRTYISNGQIDTAKKIKMIYRVLKQIHFSQKQSYPCGAAINSVAIDINGDIYPCHRFVSYDKFKIGNVFFNHVDNTHFVNKVFDYSTKFTECESCVAKHFCRCGCPYENHENTGIINRPSIRQCYFNKLIFTELIHLYIDLNEYDKKLLFGRRNKYEKSN